MSLYEFMAQKVCSLCGCLKLATVVVAGHDAVKRQREKERERAPAVPGLDCMLHSSVCTSLIVE